MPVPPKLLALSILLALIFGASPSVAQIADLPGWELSWQDEFDGPGLDTTKWEALNRRNSFNNEKQYYHPNQVAVSGGALQLTAINTPRDGKAYQSGLVTSRDLFGPGRFEARIDLPTGQGMWPAFWLNPNQVQWPTGGEIDILENRGSQPNLVSSAYHWQANPGPCCSQHRLVFEEHTASVGGIPVNYHDGFHVYAVEWEATRLRFYVDGLLHFTVTESANLPIFETPKNIILNLAVGGDFGGDPNGTTVFPQTMRVDYVRLWRPAAGLSGDYNGDGLVDAADYSVWRDTLGTTGIDLPADGSGNGTVDASDLNIWRTAFGATAGVPAVAVPEPPTRATLLLVGLVAVWPWMRPKC